ncbi:hypothetical protein KGF57_002725 [Candida theae]|uniref:Uncharacterized protein n=1 Tax=Candida theae TaxID=1198502 RepID=A0AAD5BFB2_9ASCO|nr:uncharacterized protein KGF57_002725 [Candida theae]KAI5958368.1 hypothetical protein KGF57_002725 [Candida theae]
MLSTGRLSNRLQLLVIRVVSFIKKLYHSSIVRRLATLLAFIGFIALIIYTINDFYFNPFKTFRIHPQATYTVVHSHQNSLDPSSNADQGPSFPLSKQFLGDNEFKPIPLKTFTDPHPLINGKPKDHVFRESDMCSELEFEDTFDVTKQSYLDSDFEYFMFKFNQVKAYTGLLQKVKARFKSVVPEHKQWFRFAGSSVWLSQFNVHYMVSRVLYSPSGIANKAYVSFLYVQLFDQDWKELPKGSKLTIPFEDPVSCNWMNLDGSVTPVQGGSQLRYKEVEYPQILPIPIDYAIKTENEKYYYGPEDPRIILRKNPLGFEEPLIVFNLKDLQIAKRVMFMYLPFSDKLNRLKKRTDKYAKIEKNWTPFISPNEESHNKLKFIYSLVPLEVLVCDIDTAVCDFLQNPQKKKKDYVGALRGGTQLVPLPLHKFSPKVRDSLRIPANRNVFLGWARAHLNKCGCGESMYRPNMMILIEDHNEETNEYFYKLGDVSGYLDFGAYVPPWVNPKIDSKSGQLMESNPEPCEGRNVLIPNSIAYWDIESVTRQGKTFANVDQLTSLDSVAINDYMGVTLSAADQDVSIVHLRGLLNYVIKLPSLFDETTVMHNRDDANIRGSDWNYKCAMKASKDYCKKAALKNNILEDEEEDTYSGG